MRLASTRLTGWWACGDLLLSRFKAALYLKLANKLFFLIFTLISTRRFVKYINSALISKIEVSPYFHTILTTVFAHPSTVYIAIKYFKSIQKRSVSIFSKFKIDLHKVQMWRLVKDTHAEMWESLKPTKR